MSTRPARSAGSARRAAQPRPLPVDGGLGPSCVALPPGGWATVLDFLAERFPMVARGDWLARMAAGRVLAGDGSRLDAATPYRRDLRIWYYREWAEEAPVPFQETVLFQDEQLVVADKPHFLPVMPSGRHVRETLLVRLKHRLGLDTLVPVHRIDRETAGLVVFSVQPATRGAYQRLFAERAVRKHYEAIVRWPPPAPLPAVYRSRLESVFMRSETVDGEPNAETAIAVREVRGGHALLDLAPHTGRKHQLRAQLHALGVPIVGDGIYPLLRPEGADDFAEPLRLLARGIGFDDPVTGEARCFRSGLSLAWPGGSEVPASD
ncbi:pseudouridine synthase [Pseudacidovorax intermedius]|uniref:Pseudouridine synthase n=1 Tax=Pseudacidovorax intermedius TaxID=433924 RepID=A0A147GND3_9BURK|nr:pseudouridine synthase [Pseudacidovorax intermedius]KTT15191.1 pseudouridine synthase [Pseudacidovorax intermedius]